MKTTAFYILLCSVFLHLTHSQISLLSSERIKIIPTVSLQPVTFLEFHLLPSSLHPENYTSSWTLPSGETVTMDVQSNDNRILAQESLFPVNSTLKLQTAYLIVQSLSYLDAGIYTCRIQDNTIPGSPSLEGTIELRLLLTLTAIEASVMTLDNASSVEMSCEMSDYIRPDNQLQWIKDGQLIVSGQNRKTITFTNGTRDGQIGGSTIGSSRLSTLTISNPVLSDSGTYTCRVMAANESVDIQLQVQDSNTEIPSTPVETSTSSTTLDAPLPTEIIETTPNSPTPTETSTSTPTMAAPQPSSEFPLPIVVGVIAAVLALIVVLLVIIIVVVTFRRRKISRSSTGVPQNDFQENGAYACTSNGGSHTGSLAVIPNYAKIDKTTPPPLPARPPTSLSVGNSVNSIEHAPSGYATPDVPQRKEMSGGYDPYYDDPDHLKTQPDEQFIAPPPRKSKGTSKSKTYYDDVEMIGDGPPILSAPNPYDMTTVPSPAAILNGSMQRATTSNRSPDFSYPIYNGEIPISDLNTDHDYDQIYSEPIDPTLIRSEFEFDAGSQEAIPYSAIYEDPLPLQDGVAPLMVTHDNIQEVKDLGMGQFGNVILARTCGLSLKDMRLSETDTDRNISILVAIKKLKLNAESSLTENFNKEVKFMARLMHDNVIRLLGVCKGAEAFIMMEYMENGDLNQFLQKQRLMPDTISGLQENEVTPIILLYIGVQIASGMHYLASHRFVHRDLATRNCLVGKDFVVKISDFGMSRSLYESAYYRVQGTLVLPIRWMACETFYGKFSVKSDAWAFGVVLWEIYTLGKVDPYDHMTDEEVIADAIRGPDRILPAKPVNCPQEVYDIMLRCWVHEPSMRADFGEIYSRLFMIYTRQAL